MRRFSAARSSAIAPAVATACSADLAVAVIDACPGLGRIEFGQSASRGAGQRDPPAQRIAQRPLHAQVRGRATLRVARPLHLVLTDLAQRGPRQPGQFEIVEEDLHELVARQGEREAILAVCAAFTAAAAAAPTAAAVRTRNAVPLLELAIARVDDLAITGRRVAKARLGNVADRDLHFTALLHVADRALGHHVGHRTLDLRLVAPDEAFTVDRALVAVVQATIDDHRHLMLPAGPARARTGNARRPLLPPLLRLAHPQVPLREQAHLLLGVALLHHAHHEILVLLLVFLRGLGIEGDHRQQVLGGREHLVLDDGAQLLVAGPHRVATLVGGARAQHEIHDLVAEILRVADAGGLLDLLEFLVQRRAIEVLARFRIAVLLVLDPEVGVEHVAVEQVLAVLGIGLQICRLDLLADELDVARHEEILEVLEVTVVHVLRELLALELGLQHVQQVHRVGGDLGGVEVEHAREDLERETRREAVHALVDTGVVAVLLEPTLPWARCPSAIFAVVDAHLGVDAGVLGFRGCARAPRTAPSSPACRARTARRRQRRCSASSLR
jgi:hypothetical protein